MSRRGPVAREPSAIYTISARVMIDSNVLIDLLENDPNWADWSETQLAPLAEAGLAVINPIIYAEVAANFATIEALAAAVQPFNLQREPLPWDAAFLASQAFKLYRRRGGTRSSPLPDFYIGAHASLSGYALLTRDARRYREYFPKLKILSPESP
jgi:predicted nucleic acid-binding protein